MATRAFIPGIPGRDGSSLPDFLLAKGYEVHALMRRASLFNTDRIDHLYHDPHLAGPRLTLHYGDLTDGTGLRRVLETVNPDEVYNLGAQSHVKVSFEIPEYTAEVVAVGTLRLVEAVRDHVLHGGRPVRYYQAGSSEMFGAAPPPQSETTPFYPRSPYGVSKVAAHWFAVNYREAYGLFVCNGILFNHESPRRGETFVTRKITRAVAAILAGKQDTLLLGNLEARRDWGYAPEYVEGMWRILQADNADDYVLATNETHTVKEFVEKAFAHVNLDWREFVRHDKRYERPAEVDLLIGNPAKAKKILGWEPKVRFEELIQIMVDADLLLAEKGAGTAELHRL